MARWGDEKTLNFIIHYRNHECLWNPRSTMYKNNIARNNAYDDLLKVMNEPALTLKMLKTKIKNLRSVYHTELKKIEYSKRTGSGALEIYKPTICWFEELHSFLGDTNVYRTTLSTSMNESQSPSTPNESDSNRPNSAMQSIMAEDTPQSPSTVQSQVDAISQSQEGSQSQTDEERSLLNSSNQNLPQRRFTRRGRNNNDNSITAALQRLENISSNINTQPQYDEFHYFGLNVASQLRALPLHVALNLQNEIQSSLLSARRQQIFSNMPYTLHSCVPGTTTLPLTTNTQNRQTFIPETATNTQNQQTFTLTTLPLTTDSQNQQTFIPTTATNTQIQQSEDEEEQSRPNAQTIDMLNAAWNMS